MSGWNVSDLGEQVSAVRLEGAAWLIAGVESGVQACTNNDSLHEAITREDRFSVFHIEPLRASLLNTQSSDRAVDESPLELPAKDTCPHARGTETRVDQR